MDQGCILCSNLVWVQPGPFLNERVVGLKDVADWSLAEPFVLAVDSIWPEVHFPHCVHVRPHHSVKRETDIWPLVEASPVHRHSVHLLGIRIKNSEVAMVWRADHTDHTEDTAVWVQSHRRGRSICEESLLRMTWLNRRVLITGLKAFWETRHHWLM